MTLTEQWKKGELESGWYYTQVGGFEEVSPDLYDKDDNSWLCDSDKDLSPLKVLASVPSYKEWQEEQKSLKVLAEAYCKEKEENTKLKELLNYIRDEIADMPVYALQLGFGWISEAAYRIDNAIGEKK